MAIIKPSTFWSLTQCRGDIIVGSNSSSVVNRGQGNSAYGGGEDSHGLANMIQYMITTYKADPKKGFVTGSSSGGMMTNVISAVYPDAIAAGPAYSGVAKTRESWVAQVKTFYPGYNGTYPRMQVWHGTADALVVYPNLGEEIKKWSGLDDVTWTKNLTITPQGGYMLMVYGDGTKFTAYSAVGVGHTVPVHQDLDLKWFALHKLDCGVAQI